MSNVFTITTELKLNKEYNQLVDKYISDYIEIFNKIQRLTFHRVKNYHIKNGKITLEDRNIIHAQLKEEFNLTSRAIDAILSNMLGRYEAIKELKKFEQKSLERKISTLEKDLTKLKDERALQRINLKNDYKNFNFIKYKNLKIKIYWKQNRLNTKKQKLKNLENEIETGKYKVCFGTKKLLQKDYKEFVKKRDSEIYFLGRAGDNSCNLNFQVKYNSKINQFYFRIRKEVDLDNDKFVYGQFNFNNKNYTNLLKYLLRTKESALTYRIKLKNNRVFLQIIYNFEHNKDLCVTRNSYGVVGVDFNKGFVSVNKDNKEIKVYAVKFTLPSYEQRDGVMISITECNTQNPQKYFLMKSCFISTEPDTFTLSDNFSKVTKEMNIIEFKKLLEQIFFVW